MDSGTVTNLNVVNSGDMTRDEKAEDYDRLRAVNAELLRALRICSAEIEMYGTLTDAGIKVVALAIAKSTEVTP
jgi:hypothetical protein